MVKKYLTDFGSNQAAMAASPESLAYCVNTIREGNYSTILDAGSGLSSVIFHTHFSNVKTIDDDELWGKQTQRFMQESLGKQVDIYSIKDVAHEQFDFIFYDFGGIETRIYYYELLLHLCKGALYIDDMHIGYFRDYVTAKSKGYTLKILEEETKDEFGRFGAILVK